MTIPGYGKVYNLGKPEVEGILDGPVVVQEKLDGSQFSFGMLPDGALACRSKSAHIDIDDPPAMFRPAVETVLDAWRRGVLYDSVVYRGEAFRGPKHNHLTYARAPRGGLVLFDVAPGLSIDGQADRIGCEAVAHVAGPAVVSRTTLESFMDRESQLGGPKVEGLVVKSLAKTDPHTGQRLMAKLVSEAFRESKARPKPTTDPKDILATLGGTYATEARWRKAEQHLAEAGRLTGTMRDMPLLIDEVTRDVLDEESESIRDALLAWALEQRLGRRFVAGLAEWYRSRIEGEV